MVQGELLSTHVVAGALQLAAVMLGAPRPAATELPGVHLDLQRSAGAESCPTADELVAELRERNAESASREPLYVSIQIDPRDEDFVATMQVSGRRRGIRSLLGAGPGCEALREALMVSLLVLLDEEPNRSNDDASEPKILPVSTATERAVEFAGSVWFSAGGAATHGMPVRFSGMLFTDLTLRFPLWELSAGGFYAPSREIDFDPGRVIVSASGARARACINLPVAEAVHLSGCGLAVLASLAGQSSNFSRTDSERRPWWLVGAGPELRWFASKRFAFGLSGAVLVTGHRESFSITGLEARGPAYETDRVIGWLAIDTGVRIW